MIAYASRTGTRRNLDALRGAGWRLMVSAKGPHRAEGFPYAIDNGAWTAFQKGKPFDVAAFQKVMRAMGKDADWAVVPDIVAGGAESLAMSLRWMRYTLDECQRGMLAVQDGITADQVEHLIGPRVGVFVGGSTAWKLSTMKSWTELAHRRGAWAHVARVNTARRIAHCAAYGVDSFDGTSASRFAVTLPELEAARRQLPLSLELT